LPTGHAIFDLELLAHTTFSNLYPLLLTVSGGAVVLENGDSWRDTFVATLRGDGVKLPSFFITQTSHTATYASGRRIPKHVTPIKGMNNDKMKEWIDMISEHVDQPSLLILDQASSHKSPTVIEHIGTKVLPDGTPKFQPLLLPAKASFLISPCDNSFFSAFKTHYTKLNRHTLALKKQACETAYQAVSNTTVANLFRHCGIITTETIHQIENRLSKGMTCILSETEEEYKEFYDSWKTGALQDDDLPPPPRGVGNDIILPEDSLLDGGYWV